MKKVFLVSAEDKSKAEQLLNKDDKISRGSISFKSAQTLGIDEEGFFIVLDCSEEALEIAKKLLKDIAKDYEDEEKVLKKLEEQEDSAIEGMGGIFGG